MGDKILFLLPEGSLNDATEYYINILQEGFEISGANVHRSSTLKDVRKYNKILTIEAKWFFIAKLMNPNANILNWFQGVVAEEAFMTTNSMLRKGLWHFFEAFTLYFSEMNIYVSESMKRYFEKKYKISSKSFFIMPCFNKELNMRLVDESKYNIPSFVYAGSMAKWQCIEEMICLYSEIEKEIPNSSLIILTKEIDVAEKLINQYNLKNYQIKYVSLEKLDEELRKYKYGFLLRNNHIVNNVATPTKMNSYLAAGIIPIYTDAIDDFCVNFDHVRKFLRLKDIEKKNWCQQIVNYEKSFNCMVLGEYEKSIEDIFLSYYSKDFYIKKLSDLLK